MTRARVRMIPAEQGQWILSIGEALDEEALDVVEIPMSDGALFAGIEVLGRRGGSRLEARFDSQEPPEWISALVGEEAATSIAEILSGSGPRDESLLEVRVDEEVLSLLLRFAQGLWNRRFWPASRRSDAPIPVLDTRLLDFELVAMSLDARLEPFLKDSPLIEVLLDLREADALALAENIESVDRFWEGKARGVLAGFLEALLVNEEKEEGLEDADRIERIESAIPDTGTASPSADPGNAMLWRRYFAVATSEATPHSFPHPLLVAMNEDEGEEELALVAGEWAGGEEEGGEDAEERSGWIPIDWRQNIHCLFEPAEELRWIRTPTGEIDMEAELFRPLPQIAGLARAYVYIDDLPIPIRARADGGSAESLHVKWRARVPSKARIDVVLCSGHVDPRRRSRERVEGIRESQQRAVTSARARMESVARMVCGQERPSSHEAPWLAELVALKTARADLISSEAGAGLYA